MQLDLAILISLRWILPLSEFSRDLISPSISHWFNLIFALIRSLLVRGASLSWIDEYMVYARKSNPENTKAVNINSKALLNFLDFFRPFIFILNSLACMLCIFVIIYITLNKVNKLIIISSNNIDSYFIFFAKNTKKINNK